jgi:hypothetical protein
MEIKFVDREVARVSLSSIHKQINEWGQLVADDGAQCEWANLRASSDVRQARLLCEHAIGFLPPGTSYVLQINDATYLNASERLRLRRLIYGPELAQDSKCTGSLLLSQESDIESDACRLLLVDLVVFFLDVKGHVHLASSASDNQKCIGIQDGFIYFYSSDCWAYDCVERLASCLRDSLGHPQWILDFLKQEDG